MKPRQLTTLLALALSSPCTYADIINIDDFRDDSVSGTANSDTFNFNAELTGTASALGGDDTFNVNAGGSAGAFDGGAGNDTLSYNEGLADTFSIDAADAGTANGTPFTGVENVNGNAGDDTFQFNAALSGTASGGAGNDTFAINVGSSIGSINGGAGADTVTYAGYIGPITTAINTFLNIENLIGTGNAGDILQGTAGGDVFTIDGANSGTADGISYSDFENLDGLGGDDTFDLSGGGSVASLDGGAGSDELIGAAGANAFTINAANAGSINGTSFSDIENLSGNANDDTFTFSAALSGTASGGAGNDTFAINDGGSVGSIDGGAGSDTVTYAARSSGASVDLTGFEAVENFIGSFFDDTFSLGGDLNSGILLDGSAGSDLFAVVNNSSVAGDLTITNFDTLLLALIDELFDVVGSLNLGFISTIEFDASGAGVSDGMVFDIVDATSIDVFNPAFSFTAVGLADGFYLDTNSFLTDGSVTARLLEPASVPEPGTLALLSLGLAGLGLRRRFNRA